MFFCERSLWWNIELNLITLCIASCRHFFFVSRELLGMMRLPCMLILTFSNISAIHVQCVIKEWVSFLWLHEEWIRFTEQTNRPKTASGEWIGALNKQIEEPRSDLFVPRSDSFPMNPEKEYSSLVFTMLPTKTLSKILRETLLIPNSHNNGLNVILYMKLRVWFAQLPNYFQWRKSDTIVSTVSKRKWKCTVSRGSTALSQDRRHVLISISRTFMP